MVSTIIFTVYRNASDLMEIDDAMNAIAYGAIDDVEGNLQVGFVVDAPGRLDARPHNAKSNGVDLS